MPSASGGDRDSRNEVSFVSPTGQQSPDLPGAYFVGVVPDGVARVRWTFPNGQFRPGKTAGASVLENVVVTRARRDTPPPVLHGAWYASDGQPVASSDRALLTAQAARSAAQKAQAIRSITRDPEHAARSLLASFAVFAIASPTRAKTATGDIVPTRRSRPYPLAILLWPARPLQLFGLDFAQVREVITPSGGPLYVIPGSRGLCFLTGQGGSCGRLPEVKAQGIYMTVGSLGVSRTYRLLPKTIRTITIRAGGGTQTVPVPDGIYVGPGQRTGAR